MSDIHQEAKQRFLERTDSYECCGCIWKNGTQCLGRNCPVEKERQRAIKKAEANETSTNS